MRIKTARLTGVLIVVCAGCSSDRGASDLPPVEVLSGEAAITRDAGGLLITQRSARAVIAWPRLVVTKGETVRVAQPRGAELELRSDGGARIAGRFVADGALAIADGGGVILERDASVAATNVTLAAADGAIVNDGVITTAAGGRVALTAARVVNRGRIRADGGHIFLHGDLRHGRVDVGGTLDASAAHEGDGGFIDTTAAHVAVAENLRVTTAAARGKTGTWRIDPNDYTIAPSGGDITGAQLATALVSSNVVIESSAGAASGSGNIFVNDAISYSGNQLTLTASNDIQLKRVITVGGSGTIALNPATANGPDAASAGGRLLMRMTPAGYLGRIDFPGRAGTGLLQIGGNAYTVINTLGAVGSTSGSDLQGINGATALGGFIALGSDLDAGATSTWNGGAGFQPIATFTGRFDGLGHVIKSLVINRPSTDEVGLFGLTNGASLFNVGLVGGSVTGHNDVGPLIGSITGGHLVNSFALTTVGGAYNVGGLVGVKWSGDIYTTFAGGDVVAISGNNVGGFIGDDIDGDIASSFATGRVSGVAVVGGFAGTTNNGSISNCFSTSPVFATEDSVGAFTGYTVGETPINSDYAAGYTRTSNYYNTDIGGYSGNDDSSEYPGAYYCQGDSTGLSTVPTSWLLACTSELHGSLPGSFDSNVWGTGPGLLPYLKWFYPDGAQAISGSAFLPTALPAMGARAEAWIGGVETAFGSVGATGTYSLAVPSGLMTAGSPLLVYTSTDVVSDFGGFGGLAGGKVTRVGTDSGGNLFIGVLTEDVDAASTSTSPPVDMTLRAAAIGDHTELMNFPRGLSTSAASFTVDTAQFSPGGLAVEMRTANADLHVAAPQSFTAGGLTLFATHDVSVDAPVTINGTSAFGARSDLNSTINGALDHGAFRVGFNPDGTFAGRVDVDCAGHGLVGIEGIDYNVINSLGAPGSTSGNDLQGISGAPAGSFALGADIDASPTSGWPSGFQAIGGIGGSATYTGNGDGLGHVIRNLTVGCSGVTGAPCGLFSFAQATVQWERLANFGFVGGSLNGAKYFAGALAGDGERYHFINDYSTMDVSGWVGVSSLVGEADSSLFSGSHASGTVYGGAGGGVLGWSQGYVYMMRCYSTSNVTGGDGLGGLVGETSQSEVFDECYATGNVSGTGWVGGLIGYNYGDIHRSFATGNVSGTNFVGGLAGTAWDIEDSYATGSVTGTTMQIGGLAGNAYALINVYSTGVVKAQGGAEYVGGLVGSVDTGTNNMTDVSGAFWDTQTSGALTSYIGLGEPTAAMYEQATFTGFDFTNTWFIAEGEHYPILRWQLPTCAAGYAPADGINCTDINECATANGGCAQTCNNTVGSYNCSCASGYTLDANAHGCDDVNECASGNGGCAQTCNNTVGSYNCSCASGYTLDANAHGCDDVNECASGNGGCAQTCNNTVGSYNCSCASGYTLDANAHGCDDVNECASGNGGCAQTCNNTVGSYNCSCASGYTLDANAHGCDDVNECATSNGGCAQTCNNTVGSYNCSCASGYTLNANGHSCNDVNECASGNGGCAQTCNNTVGSYNCSCASGYTLNANGHSCDDVNECASGNGGCAQTCTNATGSYSCSCGSGYTLNANGHSCDDVNECANANGGCTQSCNNTVGSYNCSCASGYTLDANGHSCDDVNECANANGGCAQNCNNTVGSYSCSCSSGYTLNVNGHGCDDINECATNNGGCAAGVTCTNTPGGFTCGACPVGYTGNGTSCTDLNECATANGGCAQTCTNSVGSYSCSCASGYTLDANGHSCDDVNECAGGNGGCAQICNNTAGSFACACMSGYMLDGDGHSCDDIDECATGASNCDVVATCTNTTGGFTCTCPSGFTGDGHTCTAITTGGPDGGTGSDGGATSGSDGGTASGSDGGTTGGSDGGTTGGSDGGTTSGGGTTSAPDLGTSTKPGGGAGGTMTSNAHSGCSMAANDPAQATSFLWAGALLLLTLGLRARRRATKI